MYLCINTIDYRVPECIPYITDQTVLAHSIGTAYVSEFPDSASHI